MMEAFFPYAAKTREITVRVAVNFLPEQSAVEQDRWFWAYHIRIENHGDRATQLMTRRWVIIDARGARQLVEGEGVVGEQPVIGPGGSYDYVSGCPLSTSSGSMQGSFQLIDENGDTLDVAIPKFALTAPVTAR